MATRLTRYLHHGAPRWAADGQLLAEGWDLTRLLAVPASELLASLAAARTVDAASGNPLPPIDGAQEVWASGVTYLRSRQAREAESNTGDVYERVYAAPRPELFFKATGFRVVGPGQPIRLRADAKWNVPEPELTLVVNTGGEIVGYTVGNDVSSRDIEGENPLYLPQAKVFDGSCALGPAILLESADAMRDLPIELTILRDGAVVFAGETRTSQMKRRLEELVAYLVKELSFPHGVFLMTGTGIVPDESFTLRVGDTVRIRVGDMEMETPVQ